MALRSLRFPFAYLKDLAAAGFDGVASTRRERSHRVYTSPSDLALWTSAAMGAAVGALGTPLFVKRKSASTVALGGLVGSVVGCSAGLVWASRGWILPAARGAARRVNAVRDAHWLETNPIDYA